MSADHLDQYRCPDYRRQGAAHRAVEHEHWRGEPYGAQVTIRNGQGDKVALVPVPARARRPGQSVEIDAERRADLVMRRARLIVAAPDLERILADALTGRDGWRAAAESVLQDTGFRPAVVGGPE